MGRRALFSVRSGAALLAFFTMAAASGSGLTVIAAPTIAGLSATGTGQLHESAPTTPCQATFSISGQLGGGTFTLNGATGIGSPGPDGLAPLNGFNASGAFSSPTLGSASLTLALPQPIGAAEAHGICSPTASLHLTGGAYIANFGSSLDTGSFMFDMSADQSGIGTFTLQFFQVAQPPPPPGISSPADGQTVNTNPVIVSGTASPNAQVTVQCATCSPSSATRTTSASDVAWSVPFTTSPGANVITARQTVGGLTSQPSTITVTFVPPTVTLMVALSPEEITLQRGEMATARLSVPSGTGPFSFDATGTPSGVSVTFDPFVLNTTGDTSVKISTNDSVSLGDKSITFTAHGAGGLTGSASIELHLWDDRVSLPSEGTVVLRGGSAAYTLTDTLLPGSSETGIPAKSVSVNSSSPGPTLTLTTTTITPNKAGASDGIFIATSPTLSLGTVIISANTTSPGGTVRSAAAPLGIYDFSEQSPGTSQILTTGSTILSGGSFLTPGSTSLPLPPIQLSVSGLPAGVESALNPAGGSGDVVWNLGIVTKRASPGTYKLTVTGTDGRTLEGGSRHANVTLVVVTPKQVLPQVRQQVSAFRDAGLLSRNQARQLLRVLNRAVSSLNRSHTVSACTALKVFDERVSRLVNGGVLTPAQGQSLTGGHLGTEAVRVAIPCPGAGGDTGATLPPPPPPPPPTFPPDESLLQSADHYFCYVAPSVPSFGPVRVTYTDDFGTRTVNAGDRNRLCNPADVNGQGIHNPEAHLTCYALRDPQGGSLPPINVLVPIINEFGGADVILGAPDRLCLPASKVRLDKTPGARPSGPPGTIDAWACYQAFGRSINRSAAIVDQFADLYPVHGFTLVFPKLLCAPARLPSIATPQPQLLLACYDAQPQEGLNVAVATNDRFGLGFMRPQLTETLCVPTER